MPSLLDLPRELRDEIWDLASQQRRGEEEAYISVCIPKYIAGSGHRRVPRLSTAFALLQACKAVHEEFAPCLYRSTFFRLSAPHAAEKWVKSIGIRNSQYIRHLLLEASFLSADINETGRSIAVHAWAHTLRLMPDVRDIKFTSAPDSPSWCEMAYGSELAVLGDAIQALGRIEKLTYYGGGRWCTAQLIRNKPQLKALCIERISMEENMSVMSTFRNLPALRCLHLHNVEAEFSPEFWLHLPPLVDLKVSKLCDSKAEREAFLEVHSKSLERFSVHYQYHCYNTAMVSRHPIPASAEVLSSLLHGLPNLVYFSFIGFKYWGQHIDSSMLLSLPSTIEEIYMTTSEIDPIKFEKSLKSLVARSSNLKSLSFEVPPSDYSLGTAFYRGVCFWDPLHRVMDMIRSSRYHSELRGCQAEICNNDIHREHVDQSGLIP